MHFNNLCCSFCLKKICLADNVFTLCNCVAVDLPPPFDYFYMIAYAFPNDLAAYSKCTYLLMLKFSYNIDLHVTEFPFCLGAENHDYHHCWRQKSEQFYFYFHVSVTFYSGKDRASLPFTKRHYLGPRILMPWSFLFQVYRFSMPK
jgi:hypothetical protein